MLSRRQTNALLIASALAPSAAFAKQKKQGKYERPFMDQPTLAAKLEGVLNNNLRQGCGGKFTVCALKADTVNGDEVMRAVVQLDWPPGLRQRPFQATSPSVQTAFDDLVRAVLTEFGTAWPGSVRV